MLSLGRASYRVSPTKTQAIIKYIQAETALLNHSIVVMQLNNNTDSQMDAKYTQSLKIRNKRWL